MEDFDVESFDLTKAKDINGNYGGVDIDELIDVLNKGKEKGYTTVEIDNQIRLYRAFTERERLEKEITKAEFRLKYYQDELSKLKT